MAGKPWEQQYDWSQGAAGRQHAAAVLQARGGAYSDPNSLHVNPIPASMMPGGGAAGATPTPYEPPIPAGYYDPTLDAQRDAATRGEAYTEQDIGLAGRRGSEDLGYETGQIQTGFQRGMEDLTTGAQRTQADILTGRNIAKTDYDRNVSMLARATQQLGRRQGEQARKYGVSTGGIALLSAAKRAENQGIAQRDLDTGYQRQVDSFDTAYNRTSEDFQRDTGRLGEDRTTGIGRADTLYNRGVADRGTALSRARDEDLFYGLDVDALKRYQATQAGWGR